MQVVLPVKLHIRKGPVKKDDVIWVQVEGTKPIQYQWIKDGDKLSDNENYKGSTSRELFIRTFNPQVRGMYQCQVRDKYGNDSPSEEVLFGKL